MNKYFSRFFITALAAVSVAVSCNDLTLDESVYHTKKYLFGDFSQVKEVMTNVYGYLESGFYDFQECATDDAVYANTPDVAKIYYDGSWSANNLVDDKWSHYYSAIRAANFLMENCPEDYEIARWDDRYKDYLAQLKNYPWEAKALRAFFHMELLKRYKTIVIADKTFTVEEVNNLMPSTYDQAVNWIEKELKDAADHLPDTYASSYYAEIGRVTKGFALAARARLLLYAASPLNNEMAEKDRYARAAAAALDFIDANNTSKTYFLRKQMFNVENQDLIFGIREATDNTFESQNFPIGYEGGNSGTCPTLNLVEAFDMADGTPFNYEKHSSALLDPSQRDPRMAKAIISNGDMFKDEIVETFIGGRNGQPKENASPTSFYLRKFVQEATRLTVGNVSEMLHLYPIFRIQEVYLNYAEALFEATGSPDFKGSLSGVNYTMSPREALNKVRTVYQMPEVPSGLTAAEFRTRLRNERRVELCFEGHRFWDIRRWKLGDKTKEIYGLKITRNLDETFSAEKVLVQSRYWNDKQYWYPISSSEIFKNQSLIQNTGW
ncbi:MAG: RagB/SusD family nutrient uptake outer membrane protein [Bacteroidales bacterium]|nr:RagB/SusD family nutrient uptake outer membrane protein [Bacteroidales bacterium]